jgi:hypothetical protein
MWHVWGRRSVHTGFWRGDLKKINHLDDLGVEIILTWMFNKRDIRAWTGFIWLRKGVSSFECGNKPSVFIKKGEFLD